MKKSRAAAIALALMALVPVLFASCAHSSATQPSESAAASSSQVPSDSTEPSSEQNAEGPRTGGDEDTNVHHYTAEAASLFSQASFSDPATGITMPYNLYLPAGYDPAEKYPLVIFIGDLSTNNNDPTYVLKEDGATVWATEEEQSKHKAIVLVPVYTEDMMNTLGWLTDESHQWNDGLQTIKDLADWIIANYAVDENRIYGTGQSQGGMATIAISDKYPDFYTAQLLVACQWDTDEMKAMVDDKLWIVVCEGDTRAYPGMQEAVAKWKELGASVAESDQMIDDTADPSVIESYITEMEGQDADIHFSVIKGGDHRHTWGVAYTYTGLRDWLFSQTKE